jgi:hypothetical protein
MKSLLIPVGAAALLFASCTSTVDVATIIAQAQAAAVAACGFLPAAETITTIVTAGNVPATNGLTEGATIANLICAAETGKSVLDKVMPGKKAIEVGGIVINGWFVK